MTYDSFVEYFANCIHRTVGSVCRCNILQAFKIFLHLSVDRKRVKESISHNVRNLFRAKKKWVQLSLAHLFHTKP
jgi:hypothetical protein